MLFRSLQPLFDTFIRSKSSELGKQNKNYTFNADFTYFGILVPLDTTFFVLEFHTLLISLSDFDDNVRGMEDVIYNKLSAENILFLIKDRIVPSDLSKILDFSLKLATVQKISETNKSFQMESKHFRVCLLPYSLVRLIWGNHQIVSL